MGTLTSGLYTKCGWPNLEGKAFHLIRWPQIYLYVLLSSDTVISSDSGACWTLIARLCERKGTKSERLAQSFKTGRGLGKEVQEEVLEKGKHSEVGGLDCRKRRGGVQCEIQSTRQHRRDRLPREEPMMDNLSRGSTTPNGKMLSSLEATLPQKQSPASRVSEGREEKGTMCQKMPQALQPDGTSSCALPGHNSYQAQEIHTCFLLLQYPARNEIFFLPALITLFGKCTDV